MQELQYSLILIIGILLTSGLFYIILYFGFQRKLALLFLSLFCFCQAGKAFLRNDARLAIDWLGISVEQAKTGTTIAYLSGVSFLLAFLVYQFNTPRKHLVLLLSLVALCIFRLMSWPALPMVLFIGLGVSVYAMREQKLGAILSVMGLSIFGLIGFLEISMISEVGYFVGIISFIVSMTLFVGYQVREKIRQQQAALLRSATLENQLLKKSLQPHFLFNSLMSLQEWIETQPSEAAHFVQALADEFRSVCSMSGQQLIEMEEEIAICRSHLQIMGYRRRANFQLETKGITGDEQIPPAIFHTLIENGLTHGYAERQDGLFTLTKTCQAQHTEYQLFNDGQQQCDDKPGNGTGLRYVKARLEESYPGRWQLHSTAVENGWLVRILISN